MIKFIDQEFSSIRENYSLGELSESDLTANPQDLLIAWLREAYQHQAPEPNAMVLSTATSDTQQVASRVVLLKAYDNNSLYFFTNYNSAKGQQIANNPQVSLLFFWPQLERQIRVAGEAIKGSRKLSVDYFKSRPFNSQLGGLISQQSQVIADRASLEAKFQAKVQQYQTAAVDCPEHWGAYQIKPSYYEFWQGRADRLHDRLVYKLQADSWDNYRLSP